MTFIFENIPQILNLGISSIYTNLDEKQCILSLTDCQSAWCHINTVQGLGSVTIADRVDSIVMTS